MSYYLNLVINLEGFGFSFYISILVWLRAGLRVGWGY